MLFGLVGERVQNAVEASKNALETQINRIGSVTQHLQQAKKDLDWHSNLWYFGGFAVFMACCKGFIRPCRKTLPFTAEISGTVCEAVLKPLII